MMSASSIPRKLILLIVGMATACCSFAQELIEEKTDFDGKELEVIWNAETNHLPASLWSYRVVPQEFSPSVISNLLSLASFTEKEKTNDLGKGRFPDGSISFYWRKSKNQRLGIYPAQGWIDYHDGTAQAGIREMPRNVPNDQQTSELATRFLPQLNLGPADFVTIPGTDRLLTHFEKGQRKRLDKSKGEYVEEVYRRGVFLVRRIDGVDFSGIGQEGGLRITFGNEGKIIELQLVWRKLIPDKRYLVADRQRIVDWIKQGKAAVPANSPIPGMQIKQLRVNSVKPLYRGELGRQTQEVCNPYALLECEVSFGGTEPKWEKLFLESPILVPISSP